MKKLAKLFLVLFIAASLIPSTSGTVTLTILTEDITAYGIGFKFTE